MVVLEVHDTFVLLLFKLNEGYTVFRESEVWF